MQTIRAIIFDWGGVLIDDPAPPMLSYLSRVWYVTPQEFTTAYKKYEADFQKGNISEPGERRFDERIHRKKRRLSWPQL